MNNFGGCVENFTLQTPPLPHELMARINKYLHELLKISEIILKIPEWKFICLEVVKQVLFERSKREKDITIKKQILQEAKNK